MKKIFVLASSFMMSSICLHAHAPYYLAYYTDANEVNPSEVDRVVAQRIRARILADSSLSQDAKYTHISVNSGQVILRGLVDSPAESARVETITSQTIGVESVINMLKVIQ